MFYHGAYWIAGYNSVDINPAEDAGNDTPTVGVPYNGAGAWKIDTSTGAPAYNYDPSVPSAPTGLTQGYTSSSAISLFWNQAAVWGAGEVSSYNVYNNGALVGTTTSTNFTVTGLKASTTYNFTIDASDQFGTSGSQPVVSAYGTNENIHPGNNLTVSFSTHAPEALSGKFFSAYVDMSLPANPVNSAIPTSDILAVSKASGLRDFSLGFLQTTEDASHNVLLSGGMPTLSWGGLGTRNSLSTGTIINEIKAIQAEGGTITISIGGYNGQDPAVVAAACGMSAAQLQAEYQTAISTYGVDHLDFDIENALTVNNTAANALRDIAVKGLQAANPGLKVTYTMAVTPNGFDSSTTNGHSNTLAVLAGAKAAGVRIDVVNIMAMDYFDGDATSESASGIGLNGMATKAISAANAAHNQLLALGINAKVMITPMPGQNDTEHEVFTLADAQAVETFAASTSWVAGLGEWSISRDNGSNGLQTGAAGHAASLTNGVGPVPGSAASSYYSSVVQSNYDFAKIFNAISVQAPGTPHVRTYSSVAGYTGANYDKVDAFATGVDKIDVSAVTSGGAVSINRGLDSSVVAFKGASGASGVSLVHGVVQGFDMVLGANTTVYISGTDTGDSIYGSSGVDVINAGWGDDSIAGMAGADTLTGGLGADTFYYYTANDSNGAGFDTLVDFATGIDKIDVSAFGSGGAVSISRSAGTSVVGFQGATGAAGFLVANGVVQASDVNTAANTTFYITGSAAGETITGSAGVDIITGGGGQDILTGGAGRDVFRYASVNDTPQDAYDAITDFTTGVDKIDLSAIGGGSVSINVYGGQSVVGFFGPTGGPTGVILLNGMIHASDFITGGATLFYGDTLV